MARLARVVVPGAALNRLDNIASSSSPADADKFVEYEYAGASMVVKATYPAVTDDPALTRIDSTGDNPYDGALDRFGRVITQEWTDGTAIDKYSYDYDRNSNRSYSDNDGPSASAKDEVYTYDDLNRLTANSRGDRSDSTVTNKARAQEWTLTQTGNWKEFKLDANGDGDYSDTSTEEVDQDRTHNDANEIYNSRSSGDAILN